MVPAGNVGGRKKGKATMARLDRIIFTDLAPTLRVLADAGITTADADWLRSPGNAETLAKLLRQARDASEKNPFELSIEEQLWRFASANWAGRWGFGLKDIERLHKTAPTWPVGRLAVRSLRVRLGEGDLGVAQTFEAHCSEIKRVFGADRYWRWELLLSGNVPFEGTDVERLRLLAGNHTHKPTVEWITADLDANRKRESIAAVRGPSSLADELLVVTWMFPELIRAIDYDKIPGMFVAGYELNVPEEDDESWQDVPYVDFDRGGGKVGLGAGWHGGGNFDFSVPSLRE